MVIRSTVSTLNQVEGSLPEEDLDDLVQEFVELNDTRAQTRFHRGFLDAVLERDLAAADPGENRERRAWYIVGHLLGQVRCHPDLDLAKSVRSLQNEECNALLDPACPAGAMLAEQMLPAMLEAGKTNEAIKWIRAHGMRTRGSIGQRLLGWSSAALLERRDPAGVGKVLHAFLEQVENREAEEEAPLRAIMRVLRRRLVVALRVAGRLTQAQSLLDRLLGSCDDGDERARLLDQRVLIALGLRSLEQLELPPEGGQRESFLATLENHRGNLIEAAEDVSSPVALFALALPVVANPRADDSQRDRAARGLRHLIDLMDRSGEPVWEHTGVLMRARFYLTVLDLRSHRACDAAPAADRLQALLEEGAPLPAEMVLEAVENAVLYETPRVAELASLAIERFRHRALESLDLVALASGSPAFRRALTDTLEESSADLKARERWNAWMDLLRGCLAAEQRDLDTGGLALDALEVLARTPELAPSFLDLLEKSDLWEPIWDTSERDEARFRVYRELGRPSQARPILVALIHRAISDARYADADDLLGLLDALQPDAETRSVLAIRLEHERGVAEQDAQGPVLESDATTRVSVYFIGGNETQQAYVSELQERIKEQYPRALLAFEIPGWSTNWGRIIDRVESAIQRSDAVVVMRFVRTHLGRTVRRLAGKYDKPWVACTGHGFDSIERAIVEAIKLASRRN